MTRREATQIIYRVINSGILDKDIEADMTDVAEAICSGDFEDCEIDERCENGYPNYCEGCQHLID